MHCGLNWTVIAGMKRSDVSEIEVVDYRLPQADEIFSRSLRETGFGVIANHPIDPVLMDECYALWAAFFQSDDKWQYIFDPKTHDGFISAERSETAKGEKQKDLKEFYHLYAGGRCPPHLKSQSFRLMQELLELASQLLAWVSNHLPASIQDSLSEPLPEMIRDSQYHLFRVIHYPPLTGLEPLGAMRAAAHEDINLLTLLPAATAEGLQARLCDGRWIDVPIRQDWIIVNAADMLQEATQGFYPATSHRVINPTGELARSSRLSMPLFLHPRDEVILSDRHTGASYRRERYEELGLDE